MRSWILAAIGFASLVSFDSSAEAGRTVIDQGTPLIDPITGDYERDAFGEIIYPRLGGSASGYCDFNGDDCSASGGVNLGYTATIGGADFTKIFVQGNGLLTYGLPVDFFESPLYDLILNGETPLLTDYNRTLVSAGQSNDLDFSSGGFLQSAFASVDQSTGTITTNFFICGAPQLVNGCVNYNEYFFTLTPSLERGGFVGLFDYSDGGVGGSDRGFVVDGQFTAVTGNSFFIPASFQGLAVQSPIPEPSTWAMMLFGFAGVGGAMRAAKRKQKAAVRYA